MYISRRATLRMVAGLSVTTAKSNWPPATPSMRARPLGVDRRTRYSGLLAQEFLDRGTHETLSRLLAAGDRDDGTPLGAAGDEALELLIAPDHVGHHDAHPLAFRGEPPAFPFADQPRLSGALRW